MTGHQLRVIRCICWCLIGSPAAREYCSASMAANVVNVGGPGARTFQMSFVSTRTLRFVARYHEQSER